MANITKQKRDKMIAFLEELKKKHSEDAFVRAFNEIENHLTEKKFGLVFEEHTEEVDELLKDNIPVLSEDSEKRIEQNRCAMACQGYGAAFFFTANNKIGNGISC